MGDMPERIWAGCSDDEGQVWIEPNDEKPKWGQVLGKEYIDAEIYEAERDLHQEDVRELQGTVDGLRSQRDALKAALEEISEGKGRYDMDPMQHAINTIDDMKELASEALKKATDNE